VERERRRRLRLLSIILLCSFILTLPMFILYVASLLRHHAPEIACIGRYGGEEFVIVYLHQNARQVESTIEQIRTIIAQSPAHLLDEETISVTISMGIAHFPIHGAKSEEILHVADEAMYHAKHTGRNRVCRRLLCCGRVGFDALREDVCCERWWYNHNGYSFCTWKNTSLGRCCATTHFF